MEPLSCKYKRHLSVAQIFNRIYREYSILAGFPPLEGTDDEIHELAEKVKKEGLLPALSEFGNYAIHQFVKTAEKEGAPETMLHFIKYRDHMDDAIKRLTSG